MKPGKAGDGFDLLHTRIRPPIVGEDMVPRPHLLDRLDSVLRKKLGLLSAPAGFGKTSLITEWLPRAEGRVAWFSLSGEDNDPVVFLHYLIAALRTVEMDLGTGALEVLRTPPVTRPESVLTHLLNDLAAVAGKLVLVLDDYHLIESPEVHRAVRFLLERMPANLHLLIATRSDPPLPLGRLRVRDQMTELRAADLGFKGEETARFFRLRLGRDMEAGDVRILEHRTEGWIAGLQLAAVSLQRGRDVRGFISDFQGDNRLVVDYLLEEVLDLQPLPTRKFLLRISILDRLSDSLCEAVAGAPDGRALLMELEKSNLFIFPMDDSRGWFRFHPLFADLLRQRLRIEQPGKIPGLHRRAAEWFETNGLKTNAVEHFLKAGDFLSASCRIEEVAADNWERGPQARLAVWFDALPAMQVESRPGLSLYHARALIMSGRHEQAEGRLAAAEKALSGTDDEIREILPDGTCRHHPLDREELSGRIAALRALLASYRGDIPRIVENAGRALADLPRNDLVWRGVAAATLGLAHGWSGDGDLAAAERAFEEAADLSRRADNFAFFLFCGTSLASVLALQGRLSRAESLYSELLEQARTRGLKNSAAAASLMSGRGMLHLQRGDSAAGLQLVDEAVDLADRYADAVIRAASLFNRMVGRIWNLDPDGAQAAARRIEKIFSETRLPPWMECYLAACRGRILLLRGDLSSAGRWVHERRLEPDTLPDSRREPEYMVLALLLVIERQWTAAENLLTRMIASAESGRRFLAALEMRILRALAAEGDGRRESALEDMSEALRRAGPEDLRIVFVGALPALSGLLDPLLDEILTTSRSRESGIPAEFVRRIITARKARRPVERAPSGLIEPLSARELEVLRLMAAGLSNREIADRLFISLNTVRTHTKNIHLKLDVHSRTQAASRARDLGLL